MADEVFTTGDANVQAFRQATAYAQNRANAAENERSLTEAARLALPAQVKAATDPAVIAAMNAAGLATQRAGIKGAAASEADLIGKESGDYRVGAKIVSWNGNAVTNRTDVLASDADVQDARSIADAAQLAANRAFTALGNLTIADLATRGEADGPQMADESRWTWLAASPLPGGVVNWGTVAPGLNGVWVRETGSIWAARWFTTPGAADSSAGIQAAIDTLPENGVIEGFGAEFNVIDVKLKSRMSLLNINFKQIGGSVDLKSCLVIDGRASSGAKSNILIHNVQINGNRAQQTNIVTGTEDGGRHGLRVLGRVTDLTITDSSAFDCASDGLELFSSDAYNPAPGHWTFERITVKRSKFNRNRRHGVSIDAARVVRFEDCQFISNGLDLNEVDPLTHGNRGSRFAGALYGNGVDVEGYGNGSQCEDVIFTRCDGRYNARGSILFLTGGDSTQPGYRQWQQISVIDCALDAGIDPSSEGWCVAFTTSAAGNPVRAYADVRVYNPTASGYVNFTSVDGPRLDGGTVYVPAPFEPVLLKYCDNAEIGPVRTPGRSGIEAVGTTRWKAARDNMAPVLPAPAFTFEAGQAGNLPAPVVSAVRIASGGTLYRITATFTPASFATPYASFKVTPGVNSTATIQTAGAANNATGVPCATSILSPLIYVALPAQVQQNPPVPVVMSVDVLIT